MITHEELKEEVNRWAKKIDVKPLEIHVRRMSRKWASCSSRGRITINSEIIKHPKKFIDKVIVHELLHLKYPNHGKMFNVLERAYLSKK
jgi:predicted metal-dependent hydrolase